MRALYIVLIALILIACGDKSDEGAKAAGQPQAVDSIESTQSAQEQVIRAFGMNPPLSVLLEILNPQGMVGLNYKPYEEDIAFMPPNISTLPVWGHMGNRSVSFESLVALKPDVVFFSEGSSEDMLEPYQKVGIKTFIVPGYHFEDIPLAIKAYKEAFAADKRVSEKADMLLAFVEEQGKRLESLQNAITERPKVYFAQGFDGLKSQCASVGQKDLAYYIGGENALDCSMLDNPSMQSSINFEILASINPEVIFVRELPFYRELMSNAPLQWKNLSAFKNHRIYYAPSTPSNWLMRPPSVMQSLGFLWAFEKVQPTLISQKEVKERAQYFFHTFLRDLSDEEYERIQGLRE